MVITAQDLSDWNSHPVTQEIFKSVGIFAQEVKERSKIRETAEQTAMQTAMDEGIVEGISILRETYEELLEEI